MPSILATVNGFLASAAICRDDVWRHVLMTADGFSYTGFTCLPPFPRLGFVWSLLILAPRHFRHATFCPRLHGRKGSRLTFMVAKALPSGTRFRSLPTVPFYLKKKRPRTRQRPEPCICIEAQLISAESDGFMPLCPYAVKQKPRPQGPGFS